MDAAQVDSVFNAVKAAIVSQRVTAASVTLMITAAMAAAEKVGGATGPEKKALVLHVVDRVISELPAGSEEKAAIAAAVSLLGPSVIDAIVAAQKGRFSGRRLFACCRRA